VVGGFAGNKRDRDARRIGQAARRRPLPPAPHQIGMVALGFRLDRRLVGQRDRRIIGKRQIDETPRRRISFSDN
jgi:hypothetical protein